MKLTTLLAFFAVMACGVVLVKSDSEEVTEPPPFISFACDIIKKRIRFRLAYAFQFFISKSAVDKFIARFVEPFLPEACTPPTPAPPEESEGGTSPPPPTRSFFPFFDNKAINDVAPPEERKKRSVEVETATWADGKSPTQTSSASGQLPASNHIYAPPRLSFLNSTYLLPSSLAYLLKDRNLSSRWSNLVQSSAYDKIRHTGNSVVPKRVRRSEFDDILNNDLFSSDNMGIGIAPFYRPRTPYGMNSRMPFGYGNRGAYNNFW